MNNESSFPLSEFLGMEVADEGGGHASAHIDAGPAHLNPHGFVHGAAVFAMVDTSMGAAVMGMLEPTQRCTTIELQMRFLRPFVEGRLTAETTVIKPGRRVMHLESRVTDQSGRLVATATSSFAVIDEAPGA
ncbi:MAG: PaaI family thioesterase [Microthrixaceae bacterium]|nr:PaaI family thioesterase [Microthrixaceae bacterium]